MAQGLRSKVVVSRSGLCLECAECGDDAAPPVLMLHGVTDSWRSVEGVMRALPRGVWGIAVTQRGHGNSDKPEEGYRTRDFARDLVEVADALGLEQFALLGHSMGAANAMRVAIDHPERVSALVLAGAFARCRGNPVLQEFSEAVLRDLEDPIDPVMVREFQEGTLAQPVAPEFIEMVVAESLRVPARVWRAAFDGFLEDDVVNDLGMIRAPTLLLWGDQDAFSRRVDQDALLRGIPGSRLSVYEGAGHALHWEEPERFARDVVAFVRAARE